MAHFRVRSMYMLQKYRSVPAATKWSKNLFEHASNMCMCTRHYVNMFVGALSFQIKTCKCRPIHKDRVQFKLHALQSDLIANKARHCKLH